jgi:RimJ/RimL family protein N-acetyltransferase
MDSLLFETDRLRIKKFQKIDFRNFLSIHQDKKIMKYFDGGPKNLEQARVRFMEIIKHQEKYNFSYRNVFFKDTDVYIGQAGLYYNYDMSLNLCYAFLEKYHGKGYATEAIIGILSYEFDKLGINKVTAMSVPENTSSVKLLKRLGAIATKEKKLFSGVKVMCFDIEKTIFLKAKEIWETTKHE